VKKTVLKTYFRRLLIAGGILLALMVLLLTVLVVLYNSTDLVSRQIERFANSALAPSASLRYSALQGNLLNEVILKNVTYRADSSVTVFAPYVHVQYRLWPLLHGEVQVSRIVVDRLEVEVNAPPSKQTAVQEETRKEQPGKESVAASLNSILSTMQNKVLVDSLLQSLPRLRLTDIEIQVSKILLLKQNIVIKDAELKVEKCVIMPHEYFFKIRKLRASVPQTGLQLKKLSFLLQGTPDRFTVNQCQLETQRSRISLSAYYHLRDTIDINLNLYEFHVDLDEFYPLLHKRSGRGDFVDGSFELSGAPRNFSGQVRAKGQVDGKTFTKADMQLAYKKGVFSIKQMDFVSDSGQIFLRGRGNFPNGGQGMLRAEHLNLHYWSPEAPPTDINGLLTFNVVEANLQKATGWGQLKIISSRLGSLPIDTLRFELRAKQGDFTILPPSFLQLEPGCRFDLEGSVSHKRQIDLLLSTFENDLAHFGWLLGVDSLSAPFDGQFHASGQLWDPNLSGEINVPSLHYKELELDSLQLQFAAQQLISPQRSGEGRFVIQSGKYASLPIRDLQFETQLNGNKVSCSNLQLYSEDNFVKAQALFRFTADSILAELPAFRIEYQGYWLSAGSPIKFRIDSGAVSVQSLRLSGPDSAALNLTGSYDLAAEDVQAAINLEHIQISPFEQFWQKKFFLDGIIDGRMKVAHLLHQPELNFDVTVQCLNYEHTDLGDLRAAFQYDRQLIHLENLSLVQDSANLKLGGDFTLSLNPLKFQDYEALKDSKVDFHARWQNISLQRFLPLLKGVKDLQGHTSGTFDIAGILSHPRLRQHIRLDDFKYEDYRLDSLRLFSQYNSGYILLDSLSGIFNGSHFMVRGWQKYNLDFLRPDTVLTDKPFSFILTSRDKAISFLGLFNEQVESVRGDYDMQLELGGTPARPAVTGGYIHLNDGAIILSRVRDPLTNVTINAGIEDSVLTFEDFRAYSVKEKDWLEKAWQFVQGLIPWSKTRLHDGRLQVSGSVGLADLNRPKIDLAVNMDEFYVDYFIENASVVASSSDLTIRGQDTLFISGELYIPQGVFEVDLAALNKSAYLSESEVELTLPYTALLLDVNIPGNFVITSSPLDLTNNFKIVIMGDLQLIQEPRSDQLQISGHLETVSGNYSSWNQNFEVRSGSIDFKNPKEINPDINLAAAKKIGNRLFEITVNGNLKKMNQDIRVTENGQDLDLSYLDKISLLTLGADIGQITTSTDSTLRSVGENVATTSVLTAVERGAEKYTGLDKVKISSNESLLDLQKMRLNNGLKDASISFGKYLTSDLYVEYRTRFGGNIPAPKLSWQAGNRLGLQYRINRNWSLDSYYEKTDRGNNKIEIGIKWEYTF